MTITPREYQVEATDAVIKAWAAGTKRPMVVLPTGSGKTVVIAGLTAARAAQSPRERVLVLAHRKELIDQAASKLRAVAPDLSVGVVRAEQDESDAQVVVASIPTLRGDARRERVVDVGTMIVDECHHATAASYRTVLDHYGCPTVGFTATAKRSDGVGLGRVWDEIVYTRDVLWMIRRGYLADVTGDAVLLEGLDLGKVATSGGDYSADSLGDALTAIMAPERVALEVRRLLARRGTPDAPGIVFCPTVATAQAFSDALSAVGLPTLAVWGDMPGEGRQDALDAFETGECQFLANCMVLTEGFDSPRAEVAVLVRATASPSLYVQMVGRVLRPYPGKAKAYVIDVTGSPGRHPLATLATLAGAAPKPPAPGQSLLEALEEWIAEQVGAQVSQWADGPVVVEAIDLFGGSRQQWLVTRGGYWFLPAGERFITLTPGRLPNSWDAAWWPAKGKGGGWIARDVPDLGYAMAAGESEITAAEDVLARKAGRWRKRPASVKQTKYLNTLLRAKVYPETVEGIEAAELNSGVIGDELSKALASIRLDSVLDTLMRGRGRR